MYLKDFECSNEIKLSSIQIVNILFEHRVYFVHFVEKLYFEEDVFIRRKCRRYESRVFWRQEVPATTFLTEKCVSPSYRGTCKFSVILILLHIF